METIHRKIKGLPKSPFHLWASLPDPSYLESEILKSAAVLDVTFMEEGSPIDLLRPDEERQALLKGLHALDRSVALDILNHVKPQDLREHLDAEPGYDVLSLVCHGEASGNLLLEDGRGWARSSAPVNWPRSWVTG